MTSEEAKLSALNKFRDLCSGYPPDATGMPINDQTLLRYLRARKFNVDQAKTLLDSTIEWRKKFKVDEMFTVWRPIVESHNATAKTYIRGFDKVK